MARYVMITPNPENDVNRYMDEWARRSGLLDKHPDAWRIGWDFHYVSPELQNRFGLWGYVAAYVLPEGFETDCPGVEYANQAKAPYAVITVYDPFAACERIRIAYKKIMEYLQETDSKRNPKRMCSPVLSMCMREMEGLVWMYLFMWTAFPGRRRLPIFHRRSLKDLLNRASFTIEKEAWIKYLRIK